MELLVQLLPYIFLMIIMYFIIIRPQKQQEKKHQLMLNTLQKADVVVTDGGFIVEIKKVEDHFYSVRMNEDVIVRLERGSVVRKYKNEA